MVNWHKFFTSILDTISDGVFISDAMGTTLYVNQMYADLVGVPARDLRGKNVRDLVSEGFFDLALNPEVVRTGKPATYMQKLKDGKNVVISGSPVFDDKGRVCLVVTFVRDETRLVGGYAQCGQELCCTRFGGQFEPVSIRMAKEQDLPLNSSKISGVCGRLMCCLRYEQAAYEDLVKAVPKVGAFVETPAGYGTVSSVNILRSSLKVKLDGQGEDVFKSYQADEIAVIPGGRPKPGEPLPSLLKDRPKPVRDEEPKEDPWALPPLFADDVYGDKKPDGASAEQGEKKKRPRRRSRGHGGKKPADAQTAPRAEHAAKEGAKDGAKEGAKPKQPQRQKSQSNRKPGARKPGDKPAGEHPERRPSLLTALRRAAKSARTITAAGIAAAVDATSPQRPAMPSPAIPRPTRRRQNENRNRCIPERYAPVFCA